MSGWTRKLAGSLKHLCAAAAIATCGGNVYAASFDFGSVMLDVNDLATQYSLSTTTWPETWGANAFIGAVAVDYSGTTSNVITSNVSGGGVSSVGTSSAAGPGGNMDVRFTLGSGGSSDRLVQSESVSWNATGLSGGEITNVALHVQGLDPNNFPGGSIWLTPGGGTTPAIPEPSTYAMFILGLLAMGFLARKRVSGFPLPT